MVWRVVGALLLATLAALTEASADAQVLRPLLLRAHPSLRGKKIVLARGKRPVVTGCLSECGPTEQSCVTQCQVCVERRLCHHLHDMECGSCLEEARATRKHFAGNGSVVRVGDSGGAPLIHEGIKQSLTRAQLQSLEEHRRVRAARRGVLSSQHLAEWAEQERLEYVEKLRASRRDLDKHDEEKKKWSEHNSLGLNDTRIKVHKLERKLRVKKKSFKKVEAKLEELQNETVDDDLEAAKSRNVKIVGATHAVRKLRWEIRLEEDDVEKEVDDLKKEEQRTRWYAKGLRSKGSQLVRDIKSQVDNLKMMRSHEQIYRKKLNSAKADYRSAVSSSRNLTKDVRRLQHEIEENPMPHFPVPTTETGDVDADFVDDAK